MTKTKIAGPLAMAALTVIGLAAQGVIAQVPVSDATQVAVVPSVVASGDDGSAAAASTDAPVDPVQVECMAKVIVHEAGNQPRAGQVAVAQVIRTRMKAKRYGADACAVIAQRGQFFDTASYDPPRSGAIWTNAVAIASDTLAGGGVEVVPGALFFHAARSPMAGRVRVAQIADHVFYR